MIHRFNLPLKRPLISGSENPKERAGVIIELRNDSGHVAYGEASPLPGFSEKDIATIENELHALGRSLAGCAVPDGLDKLSGGFEYWLGKHDLSPSSRCGVEVAALQLLAAECGVPLSRVISVTPRDYFTVNGLLSGSREMILGKAAVLTRNGFTAFKLKVGRKSVAEDIDLTQEVRQTVGNDAVLRLDANRAWGIDDAIRFSGAVKDCRIDYIEEPVQNIKLLKSLLDKKYSLPIALDESLTEIEPEDLSTFAGVKAVVLKPMMLGFERAVLYARAATDQGMMSVVSSSFESGVGLTALAHLALSLSMDDVPVGVDTLEWFAEDLLSVPFPISEGRIMAANLPDVSKTINHDFLRSPNDD